MADFTVPGTSFPICYHFVTHTLTLFPFLCFPWEYTMNKNLLVLKKKKKKRKRSESPEINAYLNTIKMALQVSGKKECVREELMGLRLAWTVSSVACPAG